MTKQDSADPERHRQRHQEAYPIVHPNVEHVHGPEEVVYGTDELVVLCLVRDGRPYVRSFVEHYSSMGVKHLVFLDNGSTDGTLEALTEYDNVTVLRTGLPYKGYHVLMKRYLIERFGRGRWSLLVDMDELFDYPYSDVIGLGSLLGYLNSNSYTAVVAQMLDMFPEKPLSGQAGNVDEPLKELHRFYDLSDLNKTAVHIKEHPRCPPSNTYASDEIATFSGGINLTIFGANRFLTKHPLVFLDDGVEPVTGPHWHRNVRVADFTGVLLHYKFLEEHLRKQAAQAVREGHRKQTRWYKKYHEVLENNASLSMKTDASKELKSVNDLVGTQFVIVSRRYMRFVESEAQRNGHHPEEGRSERLFEPFFNARAEATALAEQLGTARQQNRIQRQQNRIQRQQHLAKRQRPLGRWRRWFGR